MYLWSKGKRMGGSLVLDVDSCGSVQCTNEQLAELRAIGAVDLFSTTAARCNYAVTRNGLMSLSQWLGWLVNVCKRAAAERGCTQNKFAEFLRMAIFCVRKLEP